MNSIVEQNIVESIVSFEKTIQVSWFLFCGFQKEIKTSNNEFKNNVHNLK
jgi:hypothetical protein